MAKIGNFRLWAFWRRLQYGAGFSAFVASMMTIVYFVAFYTPANCFDGMQNGDELAVDCGGSCVRICAFEVAPPTVTMVDSFAITDSQYNAVAYIENRNTEAGTPALDYTFRLLDQSGIITERRGTTPLLPDGTYPIFEGRIATDGRTPTETTLELAPAEFWYPYDANRSQFRTVDLQLVDADARPRLNVRLENTALTEARDVEVVATIFDSMGNPLTSSQTFIQNFAPRSQSDIVFTWPRPIATTVRSCEVPSDVMIVLDRSGSMAADGGTPPEPLESAKRAAATFVQQLRATDQVGYFSYATLPSTPIELRLSSNKSTAAAAIASTVMGEDGVQYTNMGEAFRVAQAELTSARHRDDARKVIVLMTDGDVTRPLNPETGERDIEYAAQYARDLAREAKAQDIIVYTIGFGDFFSSNDAVDRDIGLIRDLATDSSKAFFAPTITDLENVYRDIAEDICEDGPARIDIIAKPMVDFATGR